MEKKLKQKEAKTILQQLSSRFSHRISESEQDVTSIDKTAINENITSENPMFKKTLAGTTYIVSVHFSQTSTESYEDKILRMLESEAMTIA